MLKLKAMPSEDVKLKKMRPIKVAYVELVGPYEK
jgi:hypothetical protein